jgi:hypothetical protein
MPGGKRANLFYTWLRIRFCGDRAWQQATTSCLHIESRFPISGSRSVENRLMFATPRLDDLTACADRSVGRQLPA